VTSPLSRLSRALSGKAWPWIAAGLGLLILVSAASRYLVADGHDFQAYYYAAQRLLHGESPYRYQVEYAFKYPAVFALAFAPFALFPYDVARTLYTILHAALALALPWGVWRFARGENTSPLLAPRFRVGVIVAFVASFRFVDNEFQISQIGLWTFAAMLGGLACLRRAPRAAPTALGTTLFTLGAVTKVHSLVAFVAFGRAAAWRRWAPYALLALAVVLLPSPEHWLDWARQMKLTTPDLPTPPYARNVQGFYPMAVTLFGWSALGYAPLLLALPFFVAAFLALPRFDLADARSQPAALFLTVATWLTLGCLSSPLPWHYTYSFAWAVLPLSWAVASRAERRGLLALALFLGLTPKGIIGFDVAAFLEGRQSVAIVFLLLGLIFARQARRLAR